MSAIALSLNEIEVTARKASMGAGLPYGLAEELGRAARWLSSRGIDGLAQVVQFLAAGGEAPEELSTGMVEILFNIDRLVGGQAAEISFVPMVSTQLLFGLCGQAADSYEVHFVLETPMGAWSTQESRESFPDVGASCEVKLRTEGERWHPQPIERRSWSTSVDVLAAAEALCARNYVPASRESRLRGAGAAKTDND